MAVASRSELEEWVSGAVEFADDEDWYDSRVDLVELPRFESASLRLALQQATNVVDSASFDDHGRRRPIASSLVAVEIGQTVRCAEFGVHHVIRHDGAPVIVWLDVSSEAVTLYGVSNNDDARSHVLAQITNAATTSSSTWRGRVLLFAPDDLDCYRHLARPKQGDVCISSALADELRRNIIVPIRHFEEVSHVVPRRGALLHGRPGTGKSWAARWAQAEVGDETTVIVATPATFESTRRVQLLFQLAAANAPTLLIMEDLDLTIRSRSEYGGGPLGELLARLDGPEQVAGVFTIATTNDLLALDAALADRPGRFDCKIEVGDATEEARRSVLHRMCSEIGVDVHDLDDVVPAVIRATTGWTLAQLVDLGQMALLDALDRGQAIDLIGAVGKFSPISMNGRDVGSGCYL